MKTPILAGILCLGCLAGNLPAETITLKDNFDRQGEAGLQLNLQNVGSSQTAWEATSNTVMAEGTGVRPADQFPFVGRVAVPPEAKEVAVEAAINPVRPSSNPTGAPPWLGVGMGNSALGNPNFGGLFILVYPSGIYSLMFNPDPSDVRSSKVVVLKSGRIQTWNPDAMNRVKLVYNRGSDSVSAFANGEELLADALPLGAKNLSLDCGYAGFSGFGQSSEARSVGGFSLTITE
ncbi:MAG: hypothetical protein WC003_07270 [Terrimicrobiaceae bacterium]